MAALLNGLSDRNTTVRKSYSTCLANICKVAKDSSVEKLVSKLNTWYMEKDGMYIRSCTLYLCMLFSTFQIFVHTGEIFDLVFLQSSLWFGCVLD